MTMQENIKNFISSALTELILRISLISFVNSGSTSYISCVSINLLKPAGHVMHQQFNIQQLYAMPTLYLFVLYLSENKQRLVPLTA